MCNIKNLLVLSRNYSESKSNQILELLLGNCLIFLVRRCSFYLVEIGMQKYPLFVCLIRYHYSFKSQKHKFWMDLMFKFDHWLSMPLHTSSNNMDLEYLEQKVLLLTSLTIQYSYNSELQRNNNRGIWIHLLLNSLRMYSCLDLNFQKAFANRLMLLKCQDSYKHIIISSISE